MDAVSWEQAALWARQIRQGQRPLTRAHVHATEGTPAYPLVVELLALQDATPAPHAAALPVAPDAEPSSSPTLMTDPVFYGALFESLDIPLWIEDFSGMFARLEALNVESPSDLERLLSSDPELLEAFEATIRVLDANPAAAAAHGVERAELLGPLTGKIADESYPAFFALIVDLMRGHDNVSAEIIIFAPDGTPRTHRFSALRLHQTGVRDHFVCYSVDIQDHKDAQRQVGTMIQYLSRIKQASEEFIYAVSHDLRSPIHTLKGLLGLLRMRIEPLGDDQLHQLTHHAERSAERVGGLIDGMLECARLEARPPERLDVVDLGDAVYRAINGLQIPLDEAGARLSVTPMPVVQGSAPMLARVFQNLIENAARYRHPERPLEIDVRAIQRGRFWRFEVEDNGLGFDPDKAELIFALFRRFHTEHNNDGLGLGLPIVRKIIHQHGGHIGAEPLPDGGARFWFTLPRTPALVALDASHDSLD